MVPDFDSRWHEYAVEYSPTGAAFYVDGQPVLAVPPCTASINRLGRNTHCGVFYDVGYYLVLNTAIGGPWPQVPDARSVFPAYHRIDYVRVSEKAH
eukprot:SAG31_NODE_15806_length_738_cov_0.968701_1_plen_96_part_00